MALSYCKIFVEIREISLNNRPKELYKISQKGTVPVLYLADETVIDESLDIMIWAFNKIETSNWLFKNKKNQIQIINENDNEFKYWLDRYKYCDRYLDNSKEYYRLQCEQFINKLNKMVESSLYLYGSRISLADIAIFPFVRQFSNVDKEWFATSYIELMSWLDNLIQLPLFISVMNKYPEYNLDQDMLITNFNT